MGDDKIGIVTINDDLNFGNRLQNFALQESIRELGGTPETIRNRPQRWPRSLLAPKLSWEVRSDPAQLVRRGLARGGARLGAASAEGPRHRESRRRAIAAFASARIAQSDALASEMDREWMRARYSLAVAGSDQIWNPVYRRASGLDFLDFVARDRRVSYAASFGVTRIPGFLRRRYAEWLAEIPALSVREEAGARIVRQLTGRTAPVVLDPTLLVGRTFWDGHIAGIQPRSEQAYAAQFFLRDATEEQRAASARRAETAALPLADLNDLGSDEFAALDPLEFVASIAHADLVLTDSFHAAAFALMYRRPLVLRERFRGDARLRTLASSHGLSLVPDRDGFLTLGTVDWARAEATMEVRRAQSRRFLSDALGRQG